MILMLPPGKNMKCFGQCAGGMLREDAMKIKLVLKH